MVAFLQGSLLSCFKQPFCHPSVQLVPKSTLVFIVFPQASFDTLPKLVFFPPTSACGCSSNHCLPLPGSGELHLLMCRLLCSYLCAGNLWPAQWQHHAEDHWPHVPHWLWQIFGPCPDVWQHQEVSTVSKRESLCAVCCVCVQEWGLELLHAGENRKLIMMRVYNVLIIKVLCLGYYIVVAFLSTSFFHN